MIGRRWIAESSSEGQTILSNARAGAARRRLLNPEIDLLPAVGWGAQIGWVECSAAAIHTLLADGVQQGYVQQRSPGRWRVHALGTRVLSDNHTTARAAQLWLQAELAPLLQLKVHCVLGD